MGDDPALDDLTRSAIQLMNAAPSTTRVRVRSGNASIKWERAGGQPEVADRHDGESTSAVQASDAAGGTDLHYLTAPMVATFYCAPAPGEQPFVQVGDVIQRGQQVGILEAMKLMNSLDADCCGRIVDVLVANGEQVEYGQLLMAIDPVDEGTE